MTADSARYGKPYAETGALPPSSRMGWCGAVALVRDVGLRSGQR